MEKIAEMWAWKTSDPMHPTLPERIQIFSNLQPSSCFEYCHQKNLICILYLFPYLTKRMVKIICGKYHNY